MVVAEGRLERRRVSPWLLLTVFVVGATVRLWFLVGPTAIWGSDSGEYYWLTEQLVREDRILFDYNGWGLAYPFFPGMFLVIGAASDLLGVDVLPALKYVVPVLAGLICVFVALIAHRVTGDGRVAALAGGWLAITGANVITTSHPMPGTLGQVLLAGLVWAVLAAYEDRRWLAVALPVGVALVLTHHLSTYFAIGILAGGAFLRELGSRRTRWDFVKVEAPLVAVLLAVTLAWWLGVSTPFRDRIVGDAFPLPWYAVAVGGVLSLLMLPLLVMVRRRVWPGFTWRAWVPGPKAGLLVAAVTWLVSGIIVSLFVFVSIPGTFITVTWWTVLYALPVLGFLGFVFAGSRAMRFHRHGWLVWGWVAAVTLSLAFSMITGNRVLFPFRHVDYWTEGLAIPAAMGAVAIWDGFRARRPSVARVGRRTVATYVVVLLVAGTVLSQPPRETIGGFEERISEAEFEGVLWVADHLPEGSVVAADHRVSSLLFGFGNMNATWDYTYHTYHAESFEEAAEEMRGVHVPAGPDQRVDYVFLSPEIRAGVTLEQWENSEPMSDAAYAKFFDDAHYACLYSDPAGCDPADNGVYVFRVRWENAGNATSPAPEAS